MPNKLEILYNPKILVNETQGVGIPRLLSGKKFPAPSINLQPIIPVSGVQLVGFRILKKVSSATIVSGFKMQMYSPLAWATPILFPFGKPKFSVFDINFTSGKRCCIMAQLSSEELLSMTIISPSIPSSAF